MNTKQTSERTCKIDGCDNPAAGLGLCWKHYKRLKAHGTTDAPQKHSVCIVDGCNNPVKYSIKGLCNKHYLRLKAKGTTRIPIVRLCSVEGCNNKHFARGLCVKHYARVRKNGQTDLIKKATEEIKDNKDANINLLWNNLQDTKRAYQIDEESLNYLKPLIDVFDEICRDDTPEVNVQGLKEKIAWALDFCNKH